ncbi:MAG TPA: hypothetical protein PLU25_11145, partial [Acidobacteriota bacterium]|nr:hypothetical protein [Acidobacteriota bacterium]
MANSIHSAITGRAAECIRTTGRWMAGAAWVVMLVAGGTATRAFGQGGSQPVMSPLQQADRQVVMLGRESRVPWQHLID